SATAKTMSDALASSRAGHGAVPANAESATTAPACRMRNSAAVVSDGSPTRCAPTAASATPAAPRSPARPTFHNAHVPAVMTRPLLSALCQHPESLHARLRADNEEDQSL